MKRLITVFTLMVCLCLVFTACVNNNPTQNPDNLGDELQSEQTDINSDNENNVPVNPVVVNVASLKGPTSMGLVKLIDDYTENADPEYAYNFAIEAAGDAISPKLIKGELDIAAVPANLASVLYNKTNGGVVVLNINTLGVLYIVENGETVTSVSDLKGKTIYASGKGNTPVYALNYMLTANGLVPGKDVFVEFKSEHAECVAAISTTENSVAMLPQPFATTAQMTDSNIRIALNINDEWEKASGKTLVTGVTVARKEFVENNPELISKFLADYKASADYANTNISEAAALIEKYGIFKAADAEKAIPFCQITCIDGADMKAPLADYLTILSEQNAASIGGKLPADDFYYNAQ